jgi:hypothetical protein
MLLISTTATRLGILEADTRSKSCNKTNMSAFYKQRGLEAGNNRIFGASLLCRFQSRAIYHSFILEHVPTSYNESLI